MPTCVTVLPQVSADYCAPGTLYSRINQIFFTRVGDTIVSPINLANFVARLDNTTALAAPGTLAKIRYFNVIGSMSAPSISEIDISMGRKVQSLGDYTIDFEVEDVSATNYSFVQTIAAQGGGQYACWFEAGGMLFGGLTGFNATLLVNYEIGAGDKELQKIKGQLKWTAAKPPDRAAYPTT
jgi:hypothetical protein